jgi:multidrug efflux pump subunit AcrA (membrane-fusion protein)
MFRPISLLLALTISGCTAAAQSPTPSAAPAPSAAPTPERLTARLNELLRSLLAAPTPEPLTISVAVADPADLKVKEGDCLRAGDLIADRARQRQRLQTQKQQLAMTL